MQYYRVKNWERFQHYKDRNPPWIKLHFEILTSPDWVMLADASKLFAVVCMLIASRNEGLVPSSPEYFQRVAYLDKVPDFKPLLSCGFLEKVLADASSTLADASNMLADARPETYRTYRTETDYEENNKLFSSVESEKKSSKIFFNEEEARFENVSDKQRKLWNIAYPALNIDMQLAKAASWIIANPKNKKSNYARFLTNWLSKSQDNARPQGGGEGVQRQETTEERVKRLFGNKEKIENTKEIQHDSANP